jgi:hypothetical protein
VGRSGFLLFEQVPLGFGLVISQLSFCRSGFLLFEQMPLGFGLVISQLSFCQSCFLLIKQMPLVVGLVFSISQLSFCQSCFFASPKLLVSFFLKTFFKTVKFKPREKSVPK